jgi:hypothetical protein
VPPVTTYRLGGTATGLIGPGLVLRVNNGDDLAIETDRSFAFAARLPSGASYAVTVHRQPSRQHCAVTAGSGTLAGDVTNLQVTCTLLSHPPLQVHFSGTVNGLKGSGLSLGLGAQRLAVPAGASSFAFPTPVNQGESTQLSVVSQPASPPQHCIAFSNFFGSGPEVANVAYVECVDDAPLSEVPGLSIERTALRFVAEEGETAAAQTVRGTLHGVATPAIVTVQATGNGLSPVQYVSLSAQSSLVTVTPRPSYQLAPGVYTDTVTVKACEDTACTRHLPGSPKTLQVTYTVNARQAPRALSPSERGVAFSSTPSGSRLTRTLVVRESAGTDVPWTAASDVGWLTVTPSGTSGSALNLTANAAALADGFHEATVSLTSAASGVRSSAVRIGLYKSAQTGATVLANPLPGVDDTYRPGPRVVDPVRPLIYSAWGNTVTAHHVHGGQRTGALLIPGFDITDMVANGDGRRLYALDKNRSGVAVIDSATLTVLRRYLPQVSYHPDNRLAVAHVAGQDLLIVSEADAVYLATFRSITPILRADTGEVVGELNETWRIGPAMLVASRDGRVVYGATEGRSGILRAARFDLRANAFGMVYGVNTATTPDVGAAALRDLATTVDGSRLAISYGTENGALVYAFDGSGGVSTLPMTRFFNENTNGHYGSVEYDATGRLFTHNFSRDVRVYAADGTLQRQWVQEPVPAVWSALPGTLRISSDGARLIGADALADAP